MSADNAHPQLLTPEQVATTCGLSRRAVYRAIERGEPIKKPTPPGQSAKTKGADYEALYRKSQAELEEAKDRLGDAIDTIRDTVTTNDVVLYMKGTKMMPQCGFSSRLAGVLNYMGVDFVDVNVLADPDIRQGIKDFSDWPTIPQLYVKGEFVGGCDIVTEMTLSGELDQLFDAKGVAYDKAAAEKIRQANA